MDRPVQGAPGAGLGPRRLLEALAGAEPAATALCDACAVSAGQEVLDLAAGDGNFALACAREGASVVASDLAPAMVERGARRTGEEGYDVEWVRGRRRGASLRGRPLRLRRLGVRRGVRAPARGHGARALPGGAARQYRRPDGLDPGQLHGGSLRRGQALLAAAPGGAHRPSCGERRTPSAPASTAWRRDWRSSAARSSGRATLPSRSSPIWSGTHPLQVAARETLSPRAARRDARGLTWTSSGAATAVTAPFASRASTSRSWRVSAVSAGRAAPARVRRRGVRRLGSPARPADRAGGAGGGAGDDRPRTGGTHGSRPRDFRSTTWLRVVR